MAKVRVVTSRTTTRAAMQTRAVRDALNMRAQLLAAKADALGAQYGIEMNASVVSGVRPKGRPYANVESTNVSQEYGDSTTERRRVLGRVAEES